MADGSIYLVIAGTFFGFIALAFVLLYPVYRFMKRQETLSDDWTPEAISRRQRRQSARPRDGSDDPLRDDGPPGGEPVAP